MDQRFDIRFAASDRSVSESIPAWAEAALFLIVAFVALGAFVWIANDAQASTASHLGLFAAQNIHRVAVEA